VLRTRIFTALVIVPTTVAIVFLPPPWLFRLLIAVVLMTGCWEFRRLADLGSVAGWALAGLQAVIIGLMMVYWPALEAAATEILAAACLAWLLMFTRLFVFRDDEKPGSGYRWLGFSGRQFGDRKLAPLISPKKTWAGVYGGIALAAAAAFLWSWAIAGLDIPAAALVVMTALTALASVGGDLFISIHKRTVGLKDTGTIFPGHGGVLDRYDSLLAGAPFFALAYGLMAA
jgi:phosphatidate cytidylyltransferase